MPLLLVVIQILLQQQQKVIAHLPWVPVQIPLPVPYTVSPSVTRLIPMGKTLLL
ncbi:hypothetical protein LMG33818_001664 [Halomonadaceae bacterium LMG 33818]